MTIGPEESSWKHVLGVAIVVFFFCVSIGHLIKPDYFLRRSGVRKGGEMLSDFKRMGFRFVGLIGAVFTGFLLFEFIEDSFAS
jgi:hypothetical protein